MTRSDTSRPEQIERYLLGKIPEDEAGRFDRYLLEDPELFSAVEAAEDELIDHYVRGELPADDRRQFEERLLPSERIRRRVEFARALHELASRGDETREWAPVTRIPDRTRRPEAPSSGPFSARLAWAACLVALLGAGLLAMINLRLQDHLHGAEQLQHVAVTRASEAEERAAELEAAVDRARGRETEASALRDQVREREERIAALEQRIDEAESRAVASSAPSSEAIEPARFLFLALATRADGGFETLERPLDGAVQLQLGLEHLRPEGPLVVTVLRDGISVWEQTGVEPTYVGPEGMVPITLPREVLLPGDYRVEVTGAEVAAGVGLPEYGFRVEPAD